jgi:hypothetical protein
MKRILITFGGSAYDRTIERTVRDGPGFGADEVLVYDNYWLAQHPFAKLNKWLFDLPNVRGICWYAFKPLVIMDALDRCQPGDVVMFVDGDTYPIADLRPLYDRCVTDGGQMLFAAQGWTNRTWVKADCWKVMAADIDVPGRTGVFYDTQHAVARFMLFQKGHYHVQQFINEWQTYCLNPLATTFDDSELWQDGEMPGFEQHRTEQAILSLLAHKYSFHLYREACQFGNGALAEGVDSWYPQTFVQEGCSGPHKPEGGRWRNV